MKKKWLIAITVLVFILIPVSIIQFQSEQDIPQEAEYSDKGVIEVEKSDLQKEEVWNTDGKYQNSGERVQNEEENLQDLNKNSQVEEKGSEEKREQRKIELTDYAHLSVEEFIRETGIPLYQSGEGEWRTEDWSIALNADADNNRIIYLRLHKKENDEESEEKADAGEVSYTIAGINPGDDVVELSHTILKDATWGYYASGYDDYTGLYLSGLGIERLTLVNMGTVDSIYAHFDMSLKENAKDLKYIWGEKIRQKEGMKNDQLKAVEEPYTEIPEYDKQPGNIDKTVVWIKYPCIEIPGEPEMTQNANNLILETVERIEDETYRKTDENIVVEADYMITYTTSKFISITFRVEIRNNNDIKAGPWQFCNINIDKNGKGATLADVGIPKEDIVAACGAVQIPLDIEGYLENYETDWNQYRILPSEYRIYVPTLNEDTGLPNEDDVVSVRMNKE